MYKEVGISKQLLREMENNRHQPQDDSSVEIIRKSLWSSHYNHTPRIKAKHSWKEYIHKSKEIETIKKSEKILEQKDTIMEILKNHQSGLLAECRWEGRGQ